MPVLHPEALIDERVGAMQAFHQVTGLRRAELDLSGGIDSAVMAGLLVLALGHENVTLAHLNIHTHSTQTQRAEALARGLGARLIVADFTSVYEHMVLQMTQALQQAGYDIAEIQARHAADKTILGSMRSTLRAPLGRGFNRLTGEGIRHGTGNECEDRFLRFYQKGGDGEVDTNPLAMLSKTEVYQLAFAVAQRFGSAALQAYKWTIAATPSPDLWGEGDKHNDETELRTRTGALFTYGRLDPETGKVAQIGTIERVARFLDEPIDLCNFDTCTSVEHVLFHEPAAFEHPKLQPKIVQKALDTHFQGFTPNAVVTLLRAAIQAERITRHKLNPNIPTLGSRESLVRLGILSNNLADYD